jgi:hypothetical protein
MLYLVAMFAIVPLAGYAFSGSWRMAWRYTVTWSVLVGCMWLAGSALSLM